jgi:undecaprenyl-diphosphatase
MEELNQIVFEALFRFAHKNFLLDYIFAFAGRYLLYILIAGFFIFLVAQRNRSERLLLFAQAALVTVIGRGIIVETLHYFYPYPRPIALGVIPLFQEIGNAFPSGHASFLFGLAAVMFLWNRRWGTAYLALALINGIGRIIAGVHWPLDIVGGIFVGTGSAFITEALLKPYLEAIRPNLKKPSPEKTA